MRRAVLYNAKAKTSSQHHKAPVTGPRTSAAGKRRGSLVEESLANSIPSSTGRPSILAKFRTHVSHDEAAFPLSPIPVFPQEKGSRWKAWMFKGEDRTGRGDGRQEGEFEVPIHPYSRFAQFWESASGVLLLYTAAVTPLLIGFYNEHQGFCGPAPTIEFDMGVDLFFFLEIIVHFLTGQVVRGSIIMEVPKVARNYLLGDFWRDLLSSSPIAWVEYFLVPDLTCAEIEGDQRDVRFMRSLRFIRMLKLLRLLKVLKIFNVMRDLLRMRPASVRLIKAGFFVFLIAHIGGCIWWFIKVQTTTDEELAFFLEAKGIETGITSTYLASVYYIMATLCTVGYGDIFAEGDAERFFALFMMMTGASVFAIIVSNMSALAANMQSRENQVLEEMENVVDFMRSNGISITLEKLVQDFYLFRCRQKTAFTSRLEVLGELPDGLHRSIMMELNRKLLSAVWVFDKMDQKEIESVVEMFELQLATPGEIVVDDDATPSYVYIIISGYVNLQVYNEGTYTDVDSLTKGEVFGEVGVILGSPCPYRAVACDYVELYKLSRDALVMLHDRSPHMQERLEAGAQERMDEFIALQSGHRNAADRWKRIMMLMLRKDARENLTLLDRAKDRLYKYSVASGRRNSLASAETASRRSGSGSSTDMKPSLSRGEERSVHTSHRKLSCPPPPRGVLSGGAAHDASSPLSGVRRRLLSRDVDRIGGKGGNIEQVRSRLSALAEIVPVDHGGVLVQCPAGRCSDGDCVLSRWRELSDQHSDAADQSQCTECEKLLQGQHVYNPQHNARTLRSELLSILQLLDEAGSHGQGEESDGAESVGGGVAGLHLSGHRSHVRDFLRPESKEQPAGAGCREAGFRVEHEDGEIGEAGNGVSKTIHLSVNGAIAPISDVRHAAMYGGGNSMADATGIAQESRFESFSAAGEDVLARTQPANVHIDGLDAGETAAAPDDASLLHSVHSAATTTDVPDEDTEDVVRHGSLLNSVRGGSRATVSVEIGHVRAGKGGGEC